MRLDSKTSSLIFKRTSLNHRMKMMKRRKMKDQKDLARLQLLSKTTHRPKLMNRILLMEMNQRIRIRSTSLLEKEVTSQQDTESQLKITKLITTLSFQRTQIVQTSHNQKMVTNCKLKRSTNKKLTTTIALKLPLSMMKMMRKSDINNYYY